MAESTDDLGDRISELAQSPASTSVDGVTIAQPNIKDVMEAQKLLRADEGIEKRGRGLRFTKLNPPGAV